MASSFNFGLLELADGESGEAAVSVVVSKAEAEAAHVKKAEAAAAADDSAFTGTPDKEKQAALKNLYYHKLQHDNGILIIVNEVKKLRDVLKKLRAQEKVLKEVGANGAHLIQMSEEQRELRLNQLSDEQRKLRQQQRKLREEQAKLDSLRKEFCLEHGFLAVEEEEPQVSNQGESVDNVNGSCYGDGNGSVHSYYDGEPDVHADGAYVYHERHVDEGYAYDNNGGRQVYPEVHKRRVWRAVKPSSDAGTEAGHKPEEKVTSDAGSEAEHKPVENGQEATTAANADAKPTSGSEKSSAKGPKSSNGEFVKKKGGNVNGSEKRKKRKNVKKNGGDEADKAKKQDSSEADVSKKTDRADVSKKTDKEPLADTSEVEKKTLAEYEKIREEKKKSSFPTIEARKVSDEEFKGLQMLEKKKLDDEEAVIKVEKVQNKAKETGKKEEKAQQEKDAKPKKVPLALKELSFVAPLRAVLRDDGSVSWSGGAPRGGFNGRGFQGRGRDNSTDSRVPAGRGGDNARPAQNEAGNYGNGAPRGGYSGGRGNGAPRGGFSGGRGDGAPRGGYSGGAPRGGYSGGRGDGGYGSPRGDYSGSRGDGYSGRGNGGYHNQGGNGGGYQQQQQQGGYERRPGNDNYYRPRGSGYSGNSGPKPINVKDPEVINVKDPEFFPPLPAAASAPARAAAPAAAPAPAPAAAATAAPAPVVQS